MLLSSNRGASLPVYGAATGEPNLRELEPSPFLIREGGSRTLRAPQLDDDRR
jgi:hypothetical protein